MPQYDGVSAVDQQSLTVGSNSRYKIFFPTYLVTVPGTSFTTTNSYSVSGSVADNGVLSMEDDRFELYDGNDRALQLTIAYTLTTTVSYNDQLLNTDTYYLTYTNPCQDTELTGSIDTVLTYLIGVESTQTVNVYDLFTDTASTNSGDVTYCRSAMILEVIEEGLLDA